MKIPPEAIEAVVHVHKARHDSAVGECGDEDAIVAVLTAALPHIRTAVLEEAREEVTLGCPTMGATGKPCAGCAAAGERIRAHITHPKSKETI